MTAASACGSTAVALGPRLGAFAATGPAGALLLLCVY